MCSGRIFYSVAVHDVDIDVDIVSALPGESMFALGGTPCLGESAAFLARSSPQHLGCTGRHSPQPPI